MEYILAFLFVLFVLSALVLILLVLFRPSEGSGLSGAFGGMGGDTAFGVKTTQVIDKIIAVVTAIFILVAVAIAKIEADSKPRGDSGAPASMVTPETPIPPTPASHA